MGFDPECLLNINIVPRELFCPICQQLVYPAESQQATCGHVYCQSCISYVVSSMNQCPLDGALLNHSNFRPLQESNPLWHSTLGQVSVRCLYYRSGCSWQGELATSLAHTTNCSYGSFPVQCNRCGQQIVHRQVQEHARTCVGIASQVYASGQISGQQQSLPNPSTNQTEQQVPQQVAEVQPAAYLQQQGYSGNPAEQRQNLLLDGRQAQNVLSQDQQQMLAAMGQQQQQMLDGRQLQNALGQEQQALTAMGQQQGAPQPYPANWNYPQYYNQQQHQQNEQYRQTVPSQKPDSSVAQAPYPVQQSQQDPANLPQQQLLQQNWVQQQQQQSVWDQSGGVTGLQQQGQIAVVPEGAVYRQLAMAAPSIQQYAEAPKYQQFATEGRDGLPSQQQAQHFHQQQMHQTPSDAPSQFSQPQVYPQWDTSATQLQQQQQNFAPQPVQQQLYMNPQQMQRSEDQHENLSAQNELQHRQLGGIPHASHEYPRPSHPDQRTATRQQQMGYESSIQSQQNQSDPYDVNQQHPPPVYSYQQSQQDLRQKAMLPMAEAQDGGHQGVPGLNSRVYPSPLQQHPFLNSRTFPLPEHALRDGDQKQFGRLSIQQHLSPERSAISRQRVAVDVHVSEDSRETGSDKVIPLAKYIQQHQQDQQNRKGDPPQRGPPFGLEHDNGLPPPFLEQLPNDIDRRDWNLAQRHGLLPRMREVPGVHIATETPYPEIVSPADFMSSYGRRRDDRLRQFSDNPGNSSEGLGASWSQAERLLSEFSDRPDSSKFSRKPAVDGPAPERYSEQLKHAQSLVARFGMDSTDKRLGADDFHPEEHDKNPLIGTHPNFLSKPPDFMSDIAEANTTRNYPKPNEFSKLSSPPPPLQEDPLVPPNPIDSYKGPMGPILRPISNINPVPALEDHMYSSHFPSNIQPFPPDPSMHSRLMPIRDSVRSKLGFFDPRTDSEFIAPDRPGPWIRTGRGFVGRPPRALGPGSLYALPFVNHRAGDSGLLPFGSRNVRNPLLDFPFNASRLSVIDRGMPSFLGGRPLFFDAAESRLEPPVRSGMGRHELENGGPELKPLDEFPPEDSNDHGRKRKKASDSPVWCRICDVNCYSVQGLEKHCQSAEHQKMAMQLVLSIKEDDEKRTKKEEEDDKKASSDGRESPE